MSGPPITQILNGGGVIINPTTGTGPTVTLTCTSVPLTAGNGIEAKYDPENYSYFLFTDGTNFKPGIGTTPVTGTDPNDPQPEFLYTKINANVADIQTPSNYVACPLQVSKDSVTNVYTLTPKIRNIVGTENFANPAGCVVTKGNFPTDIADFQVIPTVRTLINGNGTTVRNTVDSASLPGLFAVDANVQNLTQGTGIFIDKTTTPNIPIISARVADVASGQGVTMTPASGGTSASTYTPSLNLTTGLGLERTDGGALNGNVATRTRFDTTYSNLVCTQGINKQTIPNGDGTNNYGLTASVAQVTQATNSGLSAATNTGNGVVTLSLTSAAGDIARNIATPTVTGGLTVTSAANTNGGRDFTISSGFTGVQGQNGITTSAVSGNATQTLISTDAVRQLTGSNGIIITPTTVGLGPAAKAGYNIGYNSEIFAPTTVDVANYVKAPRFFGGINGLKWNDLSSVVTTPTQTHIHNIQMNPQFPGDFFYSYQGTEVNNLRYYSRASNSTCNTLGGAANIIANITDFGFTGLTSANNSVAIISSTTIPPGQTSALLMYKYTSTASPTTFLPSAVWTSIIVDGTSGGSVTGAVIGVLSGSPIIFVKGVTSQGGNQCFIVQDNQVTTVIPSLQSIASNIKHIIPTKYQPPGSLPNWILYGSTGVNYITSNSGTIASYTAAVISTQPYAYLYPLDSVPCSLRNATTGVVSNGFRTYFNYVNSVQEISPNQPTQIYDSITNTWSANGVYDYIGGSSDGAQQYALDSTSDLLVYLSESGTTPFQTLGVDVDPMLQGQWTAISPTINTTLDGYITVAGDTTVGSPGGMVVYQLIPDPAASIPTTIVAKDFDIRAEGTISLEPSYDPSNTAYTTGGTINLKSDIVNMGTTTNMGFLTNLKSTTITGAVTQSTGNVSLAGGALTVNGTTGALASTGSVALTGVLTSTAGATFSGSSAVTINAPLVTGANVSMASGKVLVNQTTGNITSTANITAATFNGITYPQGAGTSVRNVSSVLSTSGSSLQIPFSGLPFGMYLITVVVQDPNGQTPPQYFPLNCATVVRWYGQGVDGGMIHMPTINGAAPSPSNCVCIQQSSEPVSLPTAFDVFLFSTFAQSLSTVQCQVFRIN